MRVALFLHAYQPPTQFPEVTRRICQESYHKIFDVLLKNEKSRLTMNVCASLTEQLVNLGETALIDKIKSLSEDGRLELCSTAAYHPLLAMLPQDEIVRQIEINGAMNYEAYGGSYAPRGLFLPEMVYERRVGEVVGGMGYDWIILDESAFPTASITEENSNHFNLHISKSLYKLPGLELKVFFRDRPISLKMSFDPNYGIDQLVADLTRHHSEGQENYVVLAMDAENFGHHHKDNLGLLTNIMNNPDIEPVRVSDLLSSDLPVQVVEPLRSTWGVTLEEEDQKRTFPRWDNPNNPVHQAQWELFDLALSTRRHKESKPDALDRALHSDQFWWGSYNPCWHLEMVKKGAQMLRESILENEHATDTTKHKAILLAEKIVTLGKNLYGEAVVNC
jgi:alpha-amylase/alpha-mannosidase (GH57 family)